MVKDATYWAEKVKAGEISPEELLEDVYTRVEQLNPALNAVIEINKKQALEELKTRKFLPDAPFTGVPIALKMLGQAKKGMGATSSSRLFRGVKATFTDNFVTSLEQAGLVPFGKTNAPEFGFKNITDPTLYGPTTNVWDATRYSGGSSGGAVSALASGMYPIVGASDGGGSIRIPASFSGVIGLKPTRGSMPTGPNGYRDWQGASINFALTVSMRDTETLFHTMQTTIKAAPYQAPFYGEPTNISKTKNLKVAWTTQSPINKPVSAEAKEAVKQAVAFLQKEGHQVIEVPYPLDGVDLIESYYSMNGSETCAMMEDIEQALGRELTKEDMEPMTWAIYQYGKHIHAGEYVHMLNKWDQATVVMEDLFEEYDLFLTPTASDVAPRLTDDLQSDEVRYGLAHAEHLDKTELQHLVYDMFIKSLTVTPYTQLANLTGQPAISLPTYVTSENLPIGVQFMASKGREDLLFAIGYAFEQANKFILPKYYRE